MTTSPPKRRRQRSSSPDPPPPLRRSTRSRKTISNPPPLSTSPPATHPSPPPSSPAIPPPPPPSSNKNPAIQQTIKNHIDFLSNQKEESGNTLPPLHQLPCPSIVTFNSTSLSQYTKNQNAVNKTIAKFAKKFEIIFLQETKLLANDKGALKSILSNHEVYYSNNPLNVGSNATSHTAGVCTAISREISSKYKIQVIEMPNILRGHCMVIIISLPNSDFSLKLINLRLLTPSQKKVEVQESMINALRGVTAGHPSKFTILGGDLNFVERAMDTTSEFKSKSRPCWELLKKELGISECFSDLHTFFHKPGISAESQKPWSARLDRFYISHSEADLTVIKPVVVSDVHTLPTLGDRGINSHVPTSLHFFPRRKSKNGLRRISESTVENAKFVPYTKKLWDVALASRPDANPIKKLQMFNDAMMGASRQIFTEHKNEINSVIIFQKAVSLYRCLSAGVPPDAEVLRIANNTPLLALLSRGADGWCTTKLKSFIDNSFKIAGVPEGREESKHDASPKAVPINFDQPPQKKPNALKELKLKLPSTRTKIQALRVGPDNSPSSDPSKIGPVIQNYYGKIWQAVETGHDRRDNLRDYLEDYDRSVNPNDILEVTLDLVQTAIRMAPATSPGPDGVPFSAFKANMELAGPILLDVCHFLGVKRGADVLGNFNEAILFLLPKKETLEVSDTRPISVNNSGNRLVARTLFLAVVDASQKLIGDYQRMFLPGRRMTDHLYDLNGSYYRKVQENLDYFILFTDNAKAFDSIHHDFIIAALTKQGFPEWFINAVSNLLTAVRVSPSLAPDFVININRGVKQGCPLSPLLFILCYDVLHFKLSPLENIKVKAAADDLAIETDNLENAIQAFPVIDNFTFASGLGINRDKTVILSAKDHQSGLFAPAVQLIQNSNWPLVKFADRHKYLGILFGRKVQVEDIFAAPAKKAFERAQRFGAAIGRMDTQRRILTFNVFITPIFSFVQQFYVMPSSVLREYRSIMRRAISPFAGSAWPYSQLCAPTNFVGFRQPLRDPWVHNVTVILKNFDFSVINRESDLPWDLDGSLRGRSRRSTNWDSPVFSTHTELLVMEYMGADYLNWDGVSPLPKQDKTTIKKQVIQNLVISYGSVRQAAYSLNFGKDHFCHLRERCRKFGVPDTDSVIRHFDNLPKNVPAFLITHFIKLFCGALNSDGGRRRKFEPNGSVHPEKCPDNPFPCYLCDQGDPVVPGDNAHHIFSSCQCVKDAWAVVLLHPNGPGDATWHSLMANKVSPLFITDFPLAEPNDGYCRLALIMSFCWAINKTISQIRMGRCATGAGERAVALTLSLKSIWARAKKSGKRKR